MLTDGRPTAPPEQVPDLVDGDGFFHRDMAAVGLRIVTRGDVRRQLRLEIAAQFAAFAATGLTFDHVNAHKHFHVHPVIGRLVIETAARYSVRALRAPIEPGTPSGSGWLAAPFARLLARNARRHGFTTPDHVFGLARSGHMTAARIAQAIVGLPDGLSELYLHPATRDDFRGHGPAYEHRAEFEGLIAAASKAAVQRRGAALCSFAGATAAVQ